jgi:hypothetical protein
VGGAVGAGGGGFDAEEEAVGGVGGAKVFVGVEGGQGGGVGDGEEFPGDEWACWVEVTPGYSPRL